MTSSRRESADAFSQRRLALSRWDYEGGGGAGGRPHIAVGSAIRSSHTAFGRRAEVADLKGRVMELERLVVLLLAER